MFVLFISKDKKNYITISQFDKTGFNQRLFNDNIHHKYVSVPVEMKTKNKYSNIRVKETTTVQ